MPGPSHDILVWGGEIAAAWLLLAFIGNTAVRWGRGDIPVGVAIWAVRVYSRLVHHLAIRGARNVPPDPTVDGRPLIIVSNHTATVDAVLIQAAIPYPVRWMMAADMRIEKLNALWAFTRVIFVERGGKAEIAGLRDALRSLAAGESVGIFPEGRIRRTRRELHPFLPGLGLMVAKSRALVLPVVVTGTPLSESTWGAFWRPSRSKVELMPVIDYEQLGLKPAEIATELRGRYVSWLADRRV